VTPSELGPRPPPAKSGPETSSYILNVRTYKRKLKYTSKSSFSHKNTFEASKTLTIVQRIKKTLKRIPPQKRKRFKLLAKTTVCSLVHKRSVYGHIEVYGGPMTRTPTKVSGSDKSGNKCCYMLLLRPRNGSAVMWWVCLFVCQSVVSHISEITWPNFTKFLHDVPCKCGSAPSHDIAIRYILPVL